MKAKDPQKVCYKSIHISIFQNVKLEYSKAKAKKRLVCGLREVERGCKRGKIKCAIVAPNIDEIISPGGLDDIIKTIIDHCTCKEIPVVFAMNRNKLGKTLGKSTRISAVGVYDYDGANEKFKVLIEAAKAGREEKRRIDEWIEKNNLNEYGDSKITIYENGLCPTSIYDASKKTFLLDKYRFLLSRYPNQDDRPWASQKGKKKKPEVNSITSANPPKKSGTTTKQQPQKVNRDPATSTQTKSSLPLESKSTPTPIASSSPTPTSLSTSSTSPPTSTPTEEK